MAVFEDKKSSNDILNNDTMSDDKVVASYVPPLYLFVSQPPFLCPACSEGPGRPLAAAEASLVDSRESLSDGISSHGQF